jgi:D-alanine transaminase|tara:strand:+ start:98 stop:298 length:201 start_codon:yes stop_codon:yes gene_type:complete
LCRGATDKIVETKITRSFDDDEVWITNSSKHIAPVVELDGQPVGDGLVGPVWEKAMTLYEAAKYDF